ncbi:MAG: TolB family protein, partial [Gemmatimonadota bacterium]
MALRDRIRFSDVAVAPGGDRFAVDAGAIDRANDEYTSRLQVRSLPGGGVTAEIPVAEEVSGAAWSRDGERLAFAAPTTKEDASGSDLWVWRPGGESRRVLRAQEGLSDITWGPDGETIYFTGTVGEPREPDEDGVTRITEVWQRPSFYGPRSHLYAVDVETGNRRKLVGDPDHSVGGPTLSPDGSKLVFTRDTNRNVRPYTVSEVRVLDLETGETRTLLTLDEVSFGGPSGYAWSPDGRALAFCAPLPVAIEGEAPEGDVAEADTEAGRRNRKASVFETELFAVSLDDPELRWLSRGFTPAVGGGLGCSEMEWSADDGRIYVAAEDGARTVLARTDSAVESSDPAGSMELLPAPGHVLGDHGLSGGRMVGTFESPTDPPALYALEL